MWVFGGAWWTFCLLVAVAWQALAEALKHNSTMTTLNLEHNEIGAEGGKARVGVWGAWWTFCLLVAVAWQALAEALHHNDTLTTLNLEKNGIRAEDLEARFGEFFVDFPASCCGMPGRGRGSRAALHAGRRLLESSLWRAVDWRCA